jgi:hypothetical protein
MKKYILVGFLLAGAACGDAKQPEKATQGLTAALQISGYHHSFQSSRFKPGDGILSISDMGFSKLVGSNGVFAEDQINGWVLATPNGGAPSTMRPPYSVSATDHNNRVLAYFIAAGLPQDQVRNVQVHTLMKGGQSPLGVREPDKLLAYTSVLSRAINGIPVSESTAWARFNIDDEVVEESVYWPELPASVLNDAATMSAMATDPGRLRALQQSIETNAPGYGSVAGRVVIHHADSTYRGTPFFAVTYDVSPGHDRLGVGHFDANGRQVTLAHELSRAPVMSGRR